MRPHQGGVFGIERHDFPLHLGICRPPRSWMDVTVLQKPGGFETLVVGKEANQCQVSFTCSSKIACRNCDFIVDHLYSRDQLCQGKMMTTVDLTPTGSR
jgi:hypothetical protein